MTKARDIADFKFENIVDTGTEGTKIASGHTSERGTTTGQIRFNTTLGLAEYYDGTQMRVIDTPPTVSAVTPTEVESAGGGNETFTLTGTNFASGATVKFIGNDGTEVTASTTTVTNSTSISAVIAESSFENSKEPYDVKVVASSGLSGILENQINVDNAPTWTTASGSLGTIEMTETGTHATVAASDPESDTVSYSETTSVLSGAGLTLNSSTGAISGDPTDPSTGATDTYNFTLRATAGGKTADRAFSLSVVNPVADSGGGGGFSSAYSVATNATGVTNNSMTTYNLNCAQATPNDPANHWNYVCDSFKIHSGHSGTWPHYTAIQVVSGSGTPRVLNQWQWLKHTNACGNFDIYGSNQSITSGNFTTLSNWTHLGRGYAGGGGSASDCTVMSGSFNSSGYGYRWYMWVIVDGNTSALSYPSVGSLIAYAMYGARMNKV
jgi:hypothetical protein